MKDINKELVKLSAIQDIMGDSFQHVDYGMLLKESAGAPWVKKFLSRPEWYKSFVGIETKAGKAVAEAVKTGNVSAKSVHGMNAKQVAKVKTEVQKQLNLKNTSELAAKDLSTTAKPFKPKTPKKTKGTSPKTVADTSAPSTTPKPPTSQGSGGGLGKYVTGALGIGAGAGGMAIYNKENKPDPDNFDKMRGMYDNVFGK